MTAPGHPAKGRGRQAEPSVETAQFPPPILQLNKWRAGGYVTEKVQILESQLCSQGLCASGHNLSSSCLSLFV